MNNMFLYKGFFAWITLSFVYGQDVLLTCPESDLFNGRQINLTCIVSISYSSKCAAPVKEAAFRVIYDEHVYIPLCIIMDVSQCDFNPNSEGCGCVNRNNTHYTLKYTFIGAVSHNITWDCLINCLDDSLNPALTYDSKFCKRRNVESSPQKTIGLPTNPKGMSMLRDLYGAHVNMPFRIDFQVEGSPNAKINSVLVVTDERQRTYLQYNRQWTQTTVKSTFANSKYITNISLEIHNVTAEVIDCEYLLNVSNSNGFTTFSFLLRWIGIPIDADGLIPVKYIQFDALKNSTIAFNITIKGYPAPDISDIIGVDTQRIIHSLLPKWTITFQNADQKPFTTAFRLQSQYQPGDVLYQNYFAIIKNSEGSISIQFQLISQGDTNQDTERKTIAFSVTIIVAVIVGIGIVGLLKKKGIIKSFRFQRRCSVSQGNRMLMAEVIYNTDKSDDGSDIYDDIIEELEVLESPPDQDIEEPNTEQIHSSPHGHDGVKSLSLDSSSSSESVLNFLIRLRRTHNASPTLDTALSIVSHSDPNRHPERDNISLDNVSVMSTKSEYLEPVYISSTNVYPEPLNQDEDSDYEKPDNKERVYVFSRSSLKGSELNDDQI